MEQSRGLKLKEIAAQANAEDRPALEANLHKFDFDFVIPTDVELPTSFDASHSVGYIRYFVKANIMEGNSIKHSRYPTFAKNKEFSLAQAPTVSGSMP